MSSPAQRWYELFSRGARDWLRHNAKIRDAVREHLPEFIAGADVLTHGGRRRVRVPVRILEHYRFRLRDTGSESGVGQGPAAPGDAFHAPGEADSGDAPGEGGSGGGELRFVLEFQVEDIVDWIWEELQLPDLRPVQADTLTDEEYLRDGWDRRGPRSRLDRRRTLKEAVKRRAAQPGAGEGLSDDDLRFRQLARRRRPSTRAVVVFILDVSASMDRERRKLAKAFFFWALQGLRRRYAGVETVFLAHTNEAWEFTEEQFFEASASGGTVASSALRLASEILENRYDPGRYNRYLFYASDGDNYPDDRNAALDCLAALGRTMNFMGFVETPQNHLESARSEIGRVFRALEARDFSVGSYSVHKDTDIWEAIRSFFQQHVTQGT